MGSKFLARVCLLFAAAALFAAGALAGTPTEDAHAAASEWAKAVMAHDVDTQMKLLPKGLFVRPDSIERERKMRLHEKERALINGEKYLLYEVSPTAQTGTIGNMQMMVFHYRSVVQVPEGKLQRDSWLIAVAEQGSSKWSVMDGSGQSVRSIKAFVPGYAGVPPVPPAMTKLQKVE